MSDYIRDLVTDAKRLATLEREEGWTGNDCYQAMKALNELASLLAAALLPHDSGKAGMNGVDPNLYSALVAAELHGIARARLAAQSVDVCADCQAVRAIDLLLQAETTVGAT